MTLSVPYKATAWAFLAGAAYVLCFPRYDIPGLAFLFFPCLLSAVRALRSRRQAIGLGFLFSAMVGVGGFSWIVYVCQSFGDMPLPLAVLLLALFCLVAAPQMIAFLWIAERSRYWVTRLPVALRPVFWATLYVALEYLAHFVKIYPENLGDTQIAFRSISQVAALGGVPLLSFLPIFLGASLFTLYTDGRRALPAAAVALFLLVGAHFWGARERERVAALPTEVLRVGFIQHNMDDAEKRFAHTSAEEVVTTLVHKLLAETARLAAADPRPDLLLWAETSYPMVFPSGSLARSGGDSFAKGYANLVKDRVGTAGVPLLFGGYTSDLKHDYNTGILLDASGSVESLYRKQYLLVFGEYMPFDDWFPSLKTLNPMMGDFGRGPGPVPMPFHWHGGVLLLGVNICYEEILPEYMRALARAGAKVFVNLTKDSWFGDTFEPWQHFQLSVPRAIEHHLPFVRATNTGLSGVVDATGEVHLISLPYHEAYQTLEVKVPLVPEPTLYTRFGEWFAQACCALSLGLGLWAWRRRSV